MNESPKIKALTNIINILRVIADDDPNELTTCEREILRIALEALGRSVENPSYSKPGAELAIIGEFSK